jgi:hypothetical protein
MGHIDEPHATPPFRIEKSPASNSVAQGGSALWVAPELVVVAGEEGRGAAACVSRTGLRSGPSKDELSYL